MVIYKYTDRLVHGNSLRLKNYLEQWQLEALTPVVN